jgi:hypothetical protein
MWIKRKLISIRLEIVLISAQDWERFVLNAPWAWKSFWKHPMVLLRYVGQVEAHLGMFGDSGNIGVR